jgi:hypothetical protein
MILVTSKQVELLNSEQFAHLANELIKAEASANNIPRENIFPTNKINNPDGGVDMFSEHNLILNCRIPNNRGIWQYKSGKLQPKELEEELNKNYVSEELNNGSIYCLLVNDDYTPRKRNNLEKILKAKCKDKYKIFTSVEIAEWVSDYPSVAKRFFGIKGDFLTFEEWENQHKIPFQTNEKQELLFEKIKQIYTEASELRAIRLVGVNGIGKTRFTLEIIRKLKLEPITIYTDYNGIINNADLLGDLKDLSSTNPKIILVVDNCTYFNLEYLLTKFPNPNLKIISIDTGKENIEGKITGGIYSYPLNQLDRQTISTIVYSIGQKLNSDTRSHIVDIVDGSVKFAVKIADALSHHPDIKSISDLMNLPSFNLKDLVEKIFIKTDEESRVLQSLSLLTFIGVKEDMAVESKTVAKFMEISHIRLEKIAHEMEERGIVSKKGRFYYIEPSILGVWLAKDVWDVRKDEMLGLIEELPFSAQLRLLKRMSEIGNNQLANPIINYYFPTTVRVEDFEDREITDVLSILSLSAPQKFMQILEKTFKDSSHEQLLKFETGRRVVVPILQKFLLLPETFKPASRLLLKLASAENETYGNNASGIWKEIFYPHLGRSPIPPKERHILIKEAIAKKNWLETRLLGLGAIEYALSYHQYTSYSGGVGGYLPQRRDINITYEEVVESHNSALDLLQSLLEDEDKVIRYQSRKLFFETLPSLTRYSIKNRALIILEELIEKGNESFEERTLWLEALYNLLEIFGDYLSNIEKDAIEAWIKKVTGHTYRDRLIRWTGALSWRDHKAQIDNKINIAQIIDDLVEEGYHNPALLIDELDWLIQTNTSRFPYSLGVLDKEKFWFSKIEKLMPISSLFMANYLIGYAKNNNREWVDEILEKYMDSSPEMSETVFIIMRDLGVSDRYANSILNLINKNWLSLDALKSFYFDSISIETLKSIINHLITGNHPQYYSIIFRLINEWCKKNSSHNREIAIFFLSLLENSPDNWMGWHNWEKICQFYLNMFTLEITQITLKLMKHTRYSPHGHTDQRINILTSAMKIKPKEVWNLIGHQMIIGDWDSFIETSEFIKNINPNLLIDWAKENSPIGHQILAEFTDLKINKDLARALIVEFDDELTQRYLHPLHYPSGGFYSYWGKYTEHLANYFTTLEPFLNDIEPKVQEWANWVYEDIKQKIQDNKRSDDESDLFWK